MSTILNKDIWKSAGLVMLCLTVFLMPFPRSWSLWSLGGFLFFGFTGWIIEFKSVNGLIRRKVLTVLPPVIYFLLYLLYFITGAHKWEYLEDKLMFILVPVLGLPLFDSEYLKKNFRYLLISFILGILFICIFQFSRATYESISFKDGSIRFEPIISPGISRFNWNQLSTFEHATYLAIKALWAFTVVALLGKEMKLKPFYRIFLIIIFTVFIFFLSVRTSILILAFLSISFIFSRLKSVVLKIVFIIAIPAILYLFLSVARLNERFSYKLEEFNFINKFKAEKIDWINLDTRARSWFAACHLIKEHPLFGVGLDARNIITEEYRKHGYLNEANYKLNAHNQYLETQMTLGIPGTLVLLWMVFAPLIRRKKYSYCLLIYPFVLIVSVSMIFESILVRQWGIMFFVIFYCILTIPSTSGRSHGAFSGCGPAQGR